tara:strand:+ start:277 stop:465 length:189 start_codon:yes stop_codon:yes gene_type:complete
MRILIAAWMLILLAGCSSPTVFYVIEQTDIIPIRKGETMTAPKDGFFLSKMYVKDAMNARVE